MASQLLGIKTRFTNDVGQPLIGGQVYTYFAGTSTNQDSYSDAALTVPNTNPVILDDTGSADIFLKGAYRIRVFDKSGRFIEEQDNVTQAASQGDATELTNKVNAVESGLSTANTEIDKVKLDTGITATAKFGGVTRNLAEKNAEKVSIKDFGLIADGVTDDSAKLQDIELALTDKPIDLLGKTVKAAAMPENNRYMNGYFDIDGVVIPSQYVDEIQADDNLIAIGKNAGASHLGFNGVRNCIAIGEDAMTSNTKGRHNIAIGVSALHYVNGTSRSGIDGTRNIGIGGNTGRFMTTGSRNIIMGRDTAHCLTDAHLNVIMGNAAFMGDCPNTITYGEIINQTPSTAVRNVSIGAESSMYTNTSDVVSVGYKALQNMRKSVGMVGVGAYAFEAHESDLSYWNTTQSNVNLSGTYTQTSATVVEISTSTSHGLTSGFRTWTRFTTGALADISYLDDIWFQVTVIDSTKFTITYPEISDINGLVTGANGNVTISKVATNTAYSKNTGQSVGVGYGVGNGVNNYRSVGVGHETGALGLGTENTGVGFRVFNAVQPGASNTAIGAYSQGSATGVGNTSVGASTLTNTTGNGNTAVGVQSSKAITNGSDNSSLGGYSLFSATTASKCTALGVAALRYAAGTGGVSNYSNATGVGFDTRVSGDNQVQLGDSTTTTYCFGSVQNRSDERDKIIKGNITDNMIAFFNDVEFKRYLYDYRDAYVMHDDDGNVIELEKDGSKAGKREHLGVVAQQVERAMKAHNVDFAGLQHHEHNGGEDVYTIGYQEFIPILGEIVQRQQKQIDELRELITEQTP